jgi:hypothetical protein
MTCASARAQIAPGPVQAIVPRRAGPGISSQRGHGSVSAVDDRDLGRAAEQCRVGQRAPDVAGRLDRLHRLDPLGLHPLQKRAQAETLEAVRGVDDDVGVGLGAAEDVDLAQQCRVDDDQGIGKACTWWPSSNAATASSSTVVTTP